MHISTKLMCFTQDKNIDSLPIYIIKKESFSNWLKNQDSFLQNFVKQFDSNKTVLIIPNSDGNIDKVICLASKSMFSIADLPGQLSSGHYHIEYSDTEDLILYYIAFALASYKFERYKSKTSETEVKLFLPQKYQHILINIGKRLTKYI